MAFVIECQCSQISWCNFRMRFLPLEVDVQIVTETIQQNLGRSVSTLGLEMQGKDAAMKMDGWK